jgi:superfamily II DNA or RNA helicase
VQEELMGKGKKVVVVTGRTRPATRARALQDIETGSIDGIVNCGVFTEGTDIRNIGAVILLRPTMSRALLKQMIGRGLRNDAPLTIIDHVGNLANHKGILEESAEDCVDMVADTRWKQERTVVDVDNAGGTVLFVKKIEDALFKKTLRIPQTILEGKNVIFTRAVA